MPDAPYVTRPDPPVRLAQLTLAQRQVVEQLDRCRSSRAVDLVHQLGRPPRFAGRG